eukprot:COSAG04_NODE_7862_length_1055_cov_1.481172_1_plen_301_part_10
MALAIDRSLWARDGARDACADCMQSFGVFLWKHHCRFCGEVFCDACSTHRFPLAREGREADLADERVCNDCYQELCSHRQSVLERRWEDHAEEGAAAAAAEGEEAEERGDQPAGGADRAAGWRRVELDDTVTVVANPRNAAFRAQGERGVVVDVDDEGAADVWYTVQNAAGDTDEFCEADLVAVSEQAAGSPPADAGAEAEAGVGDGPSLLQPTATDLSVWLGTVGAEFEALAPKFELEGYEELRFLKEATEAEVDELTANFGLSAAQRGRFKSAWESLSGVTVGWSPTFGMELPHARPTP